ncbi:MAG TPA: hypothetical protein VLF19_10225, partial [Methylomirabilota bacterium]|nr:hypothetical protein [Methylomirabilota bacterium]
ELRPVRFGPGLHVVSSNRDLDDDTMPEKKAVDAFAAALGGLPGEAALADLLRTHDGERPICKHEERYGTVSSSIYIGRRVPRLLYADGAPCLNAFGDCSGALRAVSSGPA